MEGGELDIRVPFIMPNGDVEYVTIIVDVFPEMTNAEVDVAVADAITEFIQNRQGDSDRLDEGEVETDEFGQYVYEIGGFNPGTVF